MKNTSVCALNPCRSLGSLRSAPLKLGILLSAVLLSGCGSTLERSMFGDGTYGVGKRTLNANVRAVVANDEQQSSFAVSNFDRAAGVGPAERAYRRATLLLYLEDGGKPLGRFAAMRGTMALIPDGMPSLEKGDIVKVRTRSQYDGLKDFAQTGEGAAVLKIECEGKKKPNKEDLRRWKECAESLSWVESWGGEKTVLLRDSGQVA